MSKILAAVLFTCGLTPLVHAAPQNRITANVSSAQLSEVRENVNHRALGAQDLGAADPALALTDMTIRFSLTDQAQAALTELLLEQQQPGSANYRKWLTPEQFAAQFGLSQSDLSKVSAWLTGQGFTVTGTARSHTFITFSGSAAQVQHAFGTTIHTMTVDGEKHFANLTDPQVPSAFANVVGSISGLHDFKLVPHAKSRLVPAPASDSSVQPQFTSSISGNHYIAPGDFYTIYDESPLLTNAINGLGITVAVMGQTDISLSDVAAFRSASKLATNVPVVQLYGTDPGTVTADLPEAQLDVEWSGAAAPSATILYVNSKNVIDTSLTQAIDNNLAPIMTVSYGACESAYGLASLKSFNLLFQQANAQGITVLGPSGDSGAADCDYQVTSATGGLAVDYPAASPYVTAVGGTMFNEGTGTYWSAVTDNPVGSALSYIPEAVWNETAANTAANNGIATNISAGGGGSSAFFTKPAWQVGTGVPADYSRDVPDLSLNGAAAHDGYLFCSSGSCVNGYRTANNSLNVVGGTSVSTPSFAGLLALVEQKIASRIGNANPTLYALANSTYYSSIFHDVTTGSNSVPCTVGSTNCATGGTIGYNATTGFDLATGWGSVDALNLVNDWALVTPIGVGTGVGQIASATTVTTTTPSVTSGTSISFTAAVASGVTTTITTPTGTLQLLVDGVSSGSAVALSSGAATLALATTSLTSGAHTVTAVYSGDATYAGSKGSVSVNITSAVAADFSIAGSSATLTVKAGSTSTGVTYTLKSLNSFAGPITLSASTTSTLNAGALFTPASVTLTAGSNGTSVFTLAAFVSNSTRSPVTLAANTPSRSPARIMAGGGILLASLLLIVVPAKRRRLTRKTGILAAFLLSVAALGVSGCGSSSSAAPASTVLNSAAGTYPLTITATSGGVSHSASLTLVVQ